MQEVRPRIQGKIQAQAAPYARKGCLETMGHESNEEIQDRDWQRKLRSATVPNDGGDAAADAITGAVPDQRVPTIGFPLKFNRSRDPDAPGHCYDHVSSAEGWVVVQINEDPETGDESIYIHPKIVEVLAEHGKLQNQAALALAARDYDAGAAKRPSPAAQSTDADREAYRVAINDMGARLQNLENENMQLHAENVGLRRDNAKTRAEIRKEVLARVEEGRREAMRKVLASIESARFFMGSAADELNDAEREGEDLYGAAKSTPSTLEDAPDVSDGADEPEDYEPVDAAELDALIQADARESIEGSNPRRGTPMD